MDTLNFTIGDYQTTEIPKEEDKFKDRSLVSDLFYNFNTTTANYMNNYGDKEGLKVPFGPTRPFNLKEDEEAKKYFNSIPEKVRERINWGEVDTFEKLYAIENRIEEADKGMAHLQERLGTAGTLIFGLPAALLDAEDGLALLPIGKAYSAFKASTRVGKTFKGVVGGAAYGATSEMLYQHEMGTDVEQDVGTSALFGAALLGVGGVLSKNTRNIINTIEETNADGTVSERVLDDIEVAQLKVEDGESLLVKTEEDIIELDTELANRRAEIKTQQETLKVANVNARESAKEYNRIQKEIDNLNVEIAKQEELNNFDRLTENLQRATTESKSFTTSRKTIIKNTQTLTKERATLMKGQALYNKAVEELNKVKQEIADRAGTKKPVKALVNKYNKLEAQLKDIKATGKFETKAVSRKIRELTKAIKDNNDILKNSAPKIESYGNKIERASKELEDFYKTATYKNHSKLKRQDVNQLKTELTKYNLGSYRQKAEKADTFKKTIAKNLADNKENLNRLQEGKTLLKKQKATQKDSLKQFKAELEKAQKVKTDIETLANEGEGLLEKVGGFIPYITPKSLLHSSSNPIVRGAALRLYSPIKALKDSLGNVLPSGPDAKGFKNRYEANWTVALTDLYRGYKQAVADGYTKGEADYFDEMTKAYLKQNDEARKLAEDLGNETPTASYKHDNKYIQEGLNTINNYFTKMGTIGKNMGVEGYKTILPGLYLPRVFDATKITKMGETKAINYLAEAILKKKPSKDPIEARQQAADIVRSVQENNYMYQLVNDGYGHASDSARQKLKTLDVYDSDIQDIIGTNVLELGAAYSYSMSGRFALHKMFGFTSKDDITSFLNGLTEQGMTPKERDSMETLINTLLGTRELMSNPNSFYGKTLRMLTKGNFTIYSMGFGITSMVEIANIIGTTGLKPILDHNFDAITTVVDNMKGTKARKEWINEFRAIGIVGDIINSRAIQRYDSIDTINSNGLIEQSLDKWNNALSKYSGLLPITDALKTLSIGSGYNWLVSVAKQNKLSQADINRINRLGLSQEDLKTLRAIDKEHVTYDANGNLEAFNFDKWDEDFGQKLQDALMRHSESTVLHPDGATLPMWMSDPSSPIARIMFQFMRFPIAAYEMLSVRGFSEFDIKQMTGIAGNLALFTLLAQIKDIGNDDPRFDLDSEEGRKNMMMYMMTNNYGIGPILTMMERAYTLGTGHQPFSAWSQGASTALGITATTLRNSQDMASGLIEGDTQKALQNLLEVNPINSMPYIKHKIEPMVEAIYGQ